MADTLTPVHPLDTWREAFAALPDGLEITAEPLTAATDLRLDPAATETVTDLLGAAVPTVPDTWVATPTGRIVWLGPDEWLVQSNAHAPQELESALRAAATRGGVPSDGVDPAPDPGRVAATGAAVDVSAQRTELRLAGPLVRELLALGCALDLHPSVFPPGTCAQTTVGQVGVVLIATDDAFHILVRPSFAGHLAAWLLDAATEFTPEEPW